MNQTRITVVSLLAILALACGSPSGPSFNVSVSFYSAQHATGGCDIAWYAVANDSSVAVSYRLQINGMGLAGGTFYGSTTQTAEVHAGGASFSVTWDVSAGTWGRTGSHTVDTSSCVATNP